MFAQVTAKM